MNKSHAMTLLIALLVLAAAYAGWRAYQATPVAPEQMQQLEQLGDLSMQSLNDTLTDRLADATTGAPQERMESQLGLALFRKCSEWTEFNDNHPSENAEQNRVKACNEYREYVDSGTIPAGYTPTATDDPPADSGDLP